MNRYIPIILTVIALTILLGIIGSGEQLDTSDDQRAAMRETQE